MARDEGGPFFGCGYARLAREREFGCGVPCLVRPARCCCCCGEAMRGNGTRTTREAGALVALVAGWTCMYPTSHPLTLALPVSLPSTRAGDIGELATCGTG